VSVATEMARRIRTPVWLNLNELDALLPAIRTDRRDRVLYRVVQRLQAARQRRQRAVARAGR
jgi:hypothetical protein